MHQYYFHLIQGKLNLSVRWANLPPGVVTRLWSHIGQTQHWKFVYNISNCTLCSSQSKICLYLRQAHLVTLENGKLFQVTWVIFSIYFEQNHQTTRNYLWAFAVIRISCRLGCPSPTPLHLYAHPQSAISLALLYWWGNIHMKYTLPF